jgi:ABC-type maltose transport system permease subunit
MIKKIASFVFETANGPFVTWCCVALTLFAAFALSPMLGVVGTVIIGVLLIVQVLAAIAYLIAFFISINESRWMRALWQFLSGIAGLSFLFLGLIFAHLAKGVVNYAIWGTYEDGRSVSIECITGD